MKTSGNRKWLRIFPVLALIAVHFLLGLWCISLKSPAFDEPLFLTGGYYYNLKSDFRVNSEGGVLSQRLAALPAYCSAVELAMPTYSSLLYKAQYHVALRLIDTTDNFGRLLNRSRLIVLLLSCSLGLLLYAISSRIFGRNGGIISLFLYCFCPLVLANATLVTADICATAFFLAATYAIWQLFRRISLARFAFAAVGISGVILAKMSGLLIVPIYGICLAVACCRRYRLRCGRTSRLTGGTKIAALLGITAAGVATVYLLIWAAYDFRFTSYAQNTSSDIQALAMTWQKNREKSPIAAGVEWARQHKILPESFLHGLTYTSGITSRTTFMNGQRRPTGSLWFFPYALLVKNPLPEILLVLTGIGTLIYCSCRTRNAFARQRWRRVRFMLFCFLVLTLVYFVIAELQKFNIGIRHLLPLYPVFFLMAGALGEWFRRRCWLAMIAIAVLLGGMVWCNLAIAPFYQGYFNSLVGGPKNGWKCLVDSSLDWGQDLAALKPKLAKQNNKVYLSYFGGPYFLPERTLVSRFDYPIGFLNLKDERILLDLSPGIYCFSATMLWNIYDPDATAFETEREGYYREICRRIQEFKAAAGDPKTIEKLSTRGQEYWATTFRDFDRYRYVRLCRYLRQRQPDDYAGYSILIYHLNEAELNAAIAP